MLSPRALVDDVRTLCKLIDELSLLPIEDTSQNTVIYEALSYMHQIFLPTLLSHNIAYF